MDLTKYLEGLRFNIYQKYAYFGDIYRARTFHDQADYKDIRRPELSDANTREKLTSEKYTRAFMPSSRIHEEISGNFFSRKNP